ncbi:MAG: PTS sugar transporter subunit IIA [Pseudomonadota bacterium]
MNLADILTPSRVALDVVSASKKAALEQLARGASHGVPELTPAQAFDSLVERERLGSTALGQGIAIPHGRITHLKSMVGAFMRVDSGVEFDSIDGEPVDLFFALFVPANTNEKHLETLSHLAALFSDLELVSQLRKEGSAEKIHALLVAEPTVK